MATKVKPTSKTASKKISETNSDSKKSSTPDSKSTKDNLALKIAILGLVGTLGAAIIGIIPEIPISKPIPTEPPVIEAIEYKDPTGIFSLQYPPTFLVEERNINSNTIEVIFKHEDNNGAPDPINFPYFIVYISPTRPNPSFDNFLFDVPTEWREEEAELKLFTNKKTSNGYYTILEQEVVVVPQKFLIRRYFLIDNTEDVEATIGVIASQYNSFVTEADINDIINSFRWSLSKYKEYFR